MATAINKSKAGAAAGSTDDQKEAYIRKPFTIIASSTEADIILETDLQYWLQHNVVDASLSANTEIVYFSTASNVVATSAAGDGKFLLLPDHPVPIGPGINRVYYKTASGSVSVSILPTEHARGQF